MFSAFISDEYRWQSIEPYLDKLPYGEGPYLFENSYRTNVMFMRIKYQRDDLYHDYGDFAPSCLEAPWESRVPEHVRQVEFEEWSTIK